MSDARLDECRRRLAAIDLEAPGGDGSTSSLETAADALEFVHRSLVAELDDLLGGEPEG